MRVRKKRPGSRRTAWLKAFGIIAVAVGVLLGGIALWRIGEFWLLDIDLSPAALRSLVSGWGVWAPGASVLFMVAYTVLPLPVGAIALANGMLFGPVYGTFVTWFGAMAGALLAYGIGRWLGTAVVEQLTPARFRGELNRWSGYIGPGELLIVRLIPVISFTLINYGAGLAAVSPWTFAWTTALGILPLTVVSVLIGHGALAWSSAVWWAVVLGSVVALFAVRRLTARLRRAGPDRAPARCADSREACAATICRRTIS